VSSAFPKDIVTRIAGDFGESQVEDVCRRLAAGVSGSGNGTRERHMRCVVFLSEGSLDKLETYIDMCLLDPRDVIVAAEYDVEGDAYVRVRDFDAPFDSP
jgi:hypothetical protein